MHASRIKHNVAFVFAGAPRSFTDPFVHESIRHNLIHSFCPPRICQSVIFARLSLSDNIHQTKGGAAIKSGDGMTIAADPTLKPIVADALKRLAKYEDNTLMMHSCPLVVDWEDVGTPEEKQHMSDEFPSYRHRMFRTFDARRYSMYYNRYKAYSQVFDYEKMYGMNFTWVVHARLDTIWGEPIQPVTYWSTLDTTTNHKADVQPPPRSPTALNAEVPPFQRKVWVPDTWYTDVPDTFALLPRHYSDIFFDLDGLVAPGAMCLGGPNFDYKATSNEALIEAGYSVEERTMIADSICGNVELGGSEFILKRKLTLGGISFNIGNLGFTTLFMSVMRPINYDSLCFYLEAKRLIGWAIASQFSNDAVVYGCQHMAGIIQHYQKTLGGIVQRDLSKIPSIKPYDKGKRLSTVTATEPFVSSCRRSGANEDGEYIGINCLLDRHVTDWNFMPFKIIRHGNCVSYNSEAFGKQHIPLRGLYVANRPCIHARIDALKKEIDVVYDPDQLFHFFPLLKSTQQLKVFKNNAFECITSKPVNGGKYRSLRIQNCIVLNDGRSNPVQATNLIGTTLNTAFTTAAFSQQFLIKIHPYSSAPDRSVASKLGEPSKSFLLGGGGSGANVRSMGIGSGHSRYITSNSILPHTVTISIAQVTHGHDIPYLEDWYAGKYAYNNSKNSLMCVTIPDGGIVPFQMEAKEPKSEIYMELCNGNKNQEFVIERTTMNAWIKYVRLMIEKQRNDQNV